MVRCLGGRINLNNVGRRNVVTHVTSSRLLRQALDRFVELLENPDSLEREWEALFTEFPFILTECLSLGIEPAQLIPCRPGRAEADFYFYPRANDPLSRYGVIEIKRPNTGLLNTPRKDVIILSSDAATAVAQAQKYAIELGAEIRKTPARWLVLGSLHHIFVIAGMSAEIARKVTTELHSAQFRRLVPSNCRLIPFDVLREAALEMTFWYMAQVGTQVFADQPLPAVLASRTPESAAQNLIKYRLYVIAVRSISKRQALWVHNLYNHYSFGYAAAAKAGGEMLWPEDLDLDVQDDDGW